MASPTVAGDVILATPDQDSELAGQAVPNPHYTGNRLVYQNGEIESLDPVNIRYLKALQMHWAIVFIIFAVGVAADALVFAVILGSSRLAVIVAVLWWLVMGVVAWWFPIWVSISEWKFMIDGKGSASGAAFEHIKWAFSQRESPIHRIRVHRLSLGGSKSRDYLYVQDDVFRGYVACFPYGRDLYVGWTLWWRLPAVRWFVTIVKRYWQTFTFRGSELHSVHRYDSAKALREAIHGAARQGFDAASGLVAFQASGTAGADIAIDSIGVLDGTPGAGMDLSRFGASGP